MKRYSVSLERAAGRARRSTDEAARVICRGILRPRADLKDQWQAGHGYGTDLSWWWKIHKRRFMANGGDLYQGIHGRDARATIFGVGIGQDSWKARARKRKSTIFPS